MIFKMKKTTCAQCFRKTENLKRKKKRFHSRRTLHYTRTEKCFSLTYHYRNEQRAVRLSSICGAGGYLGAPDTLR